MKIRQIQLVGFILFVIASIMSVGYLHPDEHFQLLEFANYKMGGISSEYLPWEFDAKMRPAIQVVWVYWLCSAMKVMGIFDPFVAAMLLRMVTGLLMFWVLSIFFHRYKSEIKTKSGVIWFAILTFVLWYVPFISVRFSSESYGTIFLLLALIIYNRLNKVNTFGSFFLIGLCLGLSFNCRFQMGFMIVGFIPWLLFIRKERILNIVILTLGLVVALALGILADYWFYAEWVSTPFNYFYQNLIENKASGYGVSPIWYYAIRTPLLVFPLLGIVIVPALIIFFIKYPKHIFTWILIPFMLVHHLIGHKEMRFLFALSPFIPFIVIIIIENLSWIKHYRFFRYIFWLLNIPALLIMTLKPAYDNVAMFEYLYRKQQHAKIYYQTNPNTFMMYQFELTQKPFNKQKDLKLSFYHQPDFYPIPKANAMQLTDVVKSSDDTILWVVRTHQYSQEDKEIFKTAGIQQKVVYHTYHTWLEPINWGNWLSNEDIGAFTIVALSR